MNIVLEPTELGFRRPFTQEVTQNLTIRNNHYEPIAFKVKTTAPKQYCVRPNSGRIEAGQSVSVKVLLQAMKDDPSADYKCRDKFLVQCVAITADRESQQAAEIWAHVDKNDKGAIQEKRIRVVFLPEEGADSMVSQEISPPPSYAEPSAAAFAHPAPVGPVSRMESRPEHFSNTREAADKATTLSSSVSSNDLSSQLAEARKTISNLQRQLAEHDSGLRQRKTGSGDAADEKTGITQGVNAVQMQQAAGMPEGVPVKIVALLCLLSFCLALLF